MTQELIQGLSVHFPRGWTGVVGANGAGKSTILKLAAGLLEPDQGHVSIPGIVSYCPQRTDDPPLRLEEMLADRSGKACRIKGRLELGHDWARRWASLSHGERKRAQIAVALWLEPQVLVVDEPTNHLDMGARDMLFGILSGFSGVGLLVSHDRRFLDELCSRCLFMAPPDAILRPGNYSQGIGQAAREETAIRKQGDLARQEYLRLRREASKRQNAASQADKKRSKKGMSRKDHDAKEKINAARLTGKDGVDGKRLNQLQGRLSQARESLNGIRVKKSYEMGIWLECGVSDQRLLFDIPAGSLDLGTGRSLHYPDLRMRPQDRIALTGGNGLGKSTLLSHIANLLPIDPERLVYVPQEIKTEASRSILENVLDLPGKTLGDLMVVISRLGSRPHRVLESMEPSPGEVRKLLLALGITKSPHLIIMDEPTNHLDLPSIECLESALAECPCGLFLVSHDQRFLDALTLTPWHIEKSNEPGSYVLVT